LQIDRYDLRNTTAEDEAVDAAERRDEDRDRDRRDAEAAEQRNPVSAG